jgi:predicted AlkP superfamily phosphohydrolase/phosphomutase
MKLPPLVVLGLDSGHPELVLRWARDGTLPTIGSVLERGAYGSLAGPEMISAHGVWLSVFSGVSLREHGRYLRRPLVPGTYALDTGSATIGLPFWASLRGPGRKVAIFDAPDVALQPGLDGVQLANWGTHPSGPAPSSGPAGMVEELRRQFGSPIWSDETQGTRRRDRRIYRRLLDRVAQKGALCRHLLARDSFDLVVVVFGDSHAAGHRFWKYGPLANHQVQDEELEDAVRDVYRAIDRELGRLMAELPAGANVFVVSDHGIREGYPTWELMEAFSHRLGYQVRREPRSRWTRTLADWDRASRMLWEAARDRCAPASRGAGRWEIGTTDWSRTTAFAIPSYYTGVVRVNLKGREPEGIVDAGREYESLLDRLESDFRQLVYAGTGEPAIERVTRTAAAFGGGPPTWLPDLFVEWRSAIPGERRVVHPRAVLPRKRLGLPRANLHSRTGLVIAAGPQISARGALGDLSPLDLAPAFLALMGEPLPEETRASVFLAPTAPATPK